MDSRKTTQDHTNERTAENVIRLPRDWLGPREELVPIGPRARTAEAPDGTPTEAPPPTAASFWDENSGSLQAAMQAPADAAYQSEPEEPADVQLSGRHPPARHLYRSIPRPRLARSLSGGSSRRRGTGAVAGLLTTCVVVILAVIVETNGGTHSPSEQTASSSKSAATLTATGVDRARLNAQTPVVIETRAEPRTHHARRARVQSHRVHPTTVRRHIAARSAVRPTPTTTQPVRAPTPTKTTTPTPTPTPTTPTSTAPSSGSTSSSPSASIDRSTSSSSQQPPAFGPRGSLGPGSSPDS